MGRCSRGVLLAALGALSCDRESQTTVTPACGTGNGASAGAACTPDASPPAEPEPDASVPGPDCDAPLAPGATRDARCTPPPDDVLDAGTDADANADADADTPAPRGPCVIGTLAEVCEWSDCAPLEGAVERRRAEGPEVVTRRVCQDADGTALVSVGSSLGFAWGADIYDAETGVLVAVHGTSDYYEYCDGTSADAWYGRAIEPCAYERPDDVPDTCVWVPSHERDGGANVTPDECVFVSD